MSKFDKIFEAREQSDEDFQKKPEIVKPQKKPVASVPKRLRENKAATTAAVPSNASTTFEKPMPERNRRGRPNGKRSDPEYIGFTTYIRKNTHLKVKIALLQERQGRELSELVEELLGNWLQSKI